MPSKKVKATVSGLASRAAMAAAKKRATVSAAVIATSASTSPGADSSPAASELQTPSSSVGCVLASLSNAASTTITSISPARVTRQALAATLQTPILPTPSVTSIARDNNNESAVHGGNNNHNNDQSGSDSNYSINKSNNGRNNSKVDDEDDDNNDDDDDVDEANKNLSNNGGTEIGWGIKWYRFWRYVQ